MNPPSCLVRLVSAAVLAPPLACTAPLLRAQTTVTSTWNGSTGDWTDASRWLPSTSYPNNDAATVYSVTIRAGIATLDVPVTINRLSMTEGRISGSGDLTLLEGADIGAGWPSSAGGWLIGTGMTHLYGASRLYTSGGYPYLFLDGGRTLRNHGTFSWLGGNLTLDAGGLSGYDAIINEATGTLTAGQGASTIYALRGDTNAAFQNMGRFVKESAIANSPTTIWVASDNSGTVEVRGGSLDFAGFVSQRSGSALSGGTWVVAPAAAGDTATLHVGTTNISTIGAGADVTLRGSGATFAQINTLTTNAGAFRLLDGRNFIVSGTGAFTNSGTLELGGGSVFTASSGLTNTSTGQILGTGSIIGSLTSGGLLAPGSSPGSLTITGNLSLQPGGTTRMELGGLLAGTGYDTISATGLLSFGGTLDVLLYDAFRPGAGASFDLFDCGSSNGEFSLIKLPALDDGLSWDQDHLYTTGVLNVIPEPATYAALLGAITLGFVLMRSLCVRRQRGR
jgi:hypothetical protein